MSNMPKFRTTGNDRKTAKLFLQCSTCSKDVREIKMDEEIDITRAYYCVDHESNVIGMNPPVRDV